MDNNTLQSALAILMVRPANFGYNAQTAESNAFQEKDDSLTQHEVSALARGEFDGFIRTLKEKSVKVFVHEEEFLSNRTDSVFPNNWVSFHSDGRVVKYPMESPKRRLEREDRIIENLRSCFDISEVLDITSKEQEGKYLEGTGSIIFEHRKKYAFACESSRTDPGLLSQVCEVLGYKKILFESSDAHDIPIYHTNVMMTIGSGYTVICMESVKSAKDRKLLHDSFEDCNLEIINISFDQLNAFAGNMLEVLSSDNTRYLVMSQSAFDSLREDELRQIKKYAEPLPVNIPTIEKVGGGSARCMMAAIHLPSRNC